MEAGTWDTILETGLDGDDQDISQAPKSQFATRYAQSRPVLVRTAVLWLAGHARRKVCSLFSISVKSAAVFLVKTRYKICHMRMDVRIGGFFSTPTLANKLFIACSLVSPGAVCT